MSTPLTADHVSVAVVAAAKITGSDPIKAFSTRSGVGRSCLAPAAAALADYLSRPAEQVCAAMSLRKTAVAAAKHAGGRFWPAYAAAFDALEARFGPASPPPTPPSEGPAKPKTSAKAPAAKPAPAAPAAAAEVPAARGRAEAPPAREEAAPQRPALPVARAQTPAVVELRPAEVTPAGSGSTYSAAEQALIARLLADGYSAGQIVVEIGRQFRVSRTRNAVIGYIHRQLKRRDPAVVAKHRRASRAVSSAAVIKIQDVRAAKRAKVAAAPVIEPEFVGVSGKVWPVGPKACDLVALGPHCCKWPVGLLTGAGQLFCAEPALDEDAPYCPGHERAARGSSSAAEWDRRNLKRVPA